MNLNSSKTKYSVSSTNSSIFIFRNHVRMRRFYRILKAILIRMILAGICIYILVFYLCITNGKKLYYLFIIPISVIGLETIYITVRRKGVDFSWFSISALSYISILITLIWKQSKYKFKVHNTECKNETINHNERILFEKCFFHGLDTCEVLIVISCMYLVPLIVLRWMSPHHERLDKNAHSTLVILLVTAAADLVDFVEYVNIDKIVEDFGSVDPIMALTTVSSFTFCITLTRTKIVDYEADKKFFRYWFDFLFGTEAWSILLVTIIQEIPYLIMRSIIISMNGVFVQATIAFFFLKNILMILANVYRLISIYCDYREIIELKQNEKREKRISFDSINLEQRFSISADATNPTNSNSSVNNTDISTSESNTISAL